MASQNIGYFDDICGETINGRIIYYHVVERIQVLSNNFFH